MWTPQQHLQEGRYTIERILGRGGFGLTYRAWDGRKGEWVVLKTLNEDLQTEPNFEKLQQDFLNEALRLARCRHPHIVRVEEVILEQGLWCIVMEYVDGLTLQRHLAHHGPMAEVEALRIIQEVGSALSALHSQDMLHRDVKPANILLRAQPKEAVLIDFGLVRDFLPGRIQHHTSYGTDGYAPIEQYDTLRRRGAWIDVYGLAATLYTALTKEIPLCAPVRMSGRELDPPQQINPNISDVTHHAILAGMALKAEDRPASIAEWIQLLPAPPNLSPAVPVLPISIPTEGISSADLQELEQILKSSAPPIPTPNLTPSSKAESPRELGDDVGSLAWVKSAHNADILMQIRDLLQAKRIQSADQLTTFLMLKIAGRLDIGHFDVKSIKDFPCRELHLIDKIWTAYSEGQFGFGIQGSLWSQAPRDIDAWGQAVGWIQAGRWLHYNELKYSLQAPKGHLPIGFLAGTLGGLRSGLLLFDRYVLAKWTACYASGSMR